MRRSSGEHHVCLAGAFEQQAQHSSGPLVGLGRQLRHRDVHRDMERRRQLSRCRQGPPDLVNGYPGTFALGQAFPWGRGTRHEPFGRGISMRRCATLGRKAFQQLAEPSCFEVGHHAPGCDVASLPFHPGSQQLVCVGGGDFHGRQTTANGPRATALPPSDPAPAPRAASGLQQARGSQGCSWSAEALTGLPSGVGTVVAGATVVLLWSRGLCRRRRSSGRGSSGSRRPSRRWSAWQLWPTRRPWYRGPPVMEPLGERGVQLQHDRSREVLHHVEGLSDIARAVVDEGLGDVGRDLSGRSRWSP